jgi:hypothetical protein
MTYGTGAVLTLAAGSNASACIQRVLYNRGNFEIISNSVSQTGPGLSVVDNILLTDDPTVDQVFAITAQPSTANNVVKLEAFKLHVTF